MKVVRYVVLGIAFVSVLASCGYAGGYEFRGRTEGDDLGSYFSREQLGRSLLCGVPRSRSARSPRVPVRGVRVDVEPEECRFYLYYREDGKKHSAVLDSADGLKTDLEEKLATLDETRIKVEVCSYDPSTSLGGIFKKQKAWIRLEFKITVKLNTGDEKESWKDAKLVAKVLDIIDQIRKDGKLERKLTKGRVTYAVESIESTKKQLLVKLEKEVKALKDSHVKINGFEESDLFCDVQFGDIHAETQSLEKVTVVLPYAVRFELKDQKEE